VLAEKQCFCILLTEMVYVVIMLAASNLLFVFKSFLYYSALLKNCSYYDANCSYYNLIMLSGNETENNKYLSDLTEKKRFNQRFCWLVCGAMLCVLQMAYDSN